MAQKTVLICKGCSKRVKTYVKCFDCESIYHPLCMGQLQGFIVDVKGKLFCCTNITSKNVTSKEPEIEIEEEELLEPIRIETIVDDAPKQEEKPSNETVKIYHKEYRCTHCPYVAKRSDRLRQHILRHSDIRSYQCDICSRRFKQYGTLYRHRISIHFEQKYSCDFCTFKTYFNYLLVKHVQTRH